MIIDKVKPFYTAEDYRIQADYRRQVAELLKLSEVNTQKLQDAKDNGDEVLFGELQEQLYELSNKMAELLEAESRLLGEVEQRYIDAFNGDVSNILADVREIVGAIEKEDYLSFQKWRTESFKTRVKIKPKRDASATEKAGYKAAKELSVRGYENCRRFILWQLRVQTNALYYYKSKEGKEQAVAIVEDKAASFYTKPKGTKPRREPLERDLPIIDRAAIRGELLTLPSSPSINLLYDVLGAGDLDNLPALKGRYNRNIQLDVEEQGDKRRVSYTKDKTAVSIEIDDFRKVANRNPQAKKILTRILWRANEQAIYNGELMRDKVTFPLRELVGEGQYKNLETARQGFYNVADTLTGLKISGKIERGGKKKTIQQGVHAVLFKGIKVDNATCEIYLNELLNWGLITPYYTGLPDYYFELPDRAAELLEYIFYEARQHTRQLAEQGYFTISYRAIQYRLNLPNEDTIRNTKRDIKDAIEGAIEQIEERYRKYAVPLQPGEEPDFSLLPLGDYEAPIKKYLNEGRLQVSLKGLYAERFIEISQKTADKVEAARRRQERIEDRAKAINLAKSTEGKPTKK